METLVTKGKRAFLDVLDKMDILGFLVSLETKASLASRDFMDYMD